MRNGNSDDSWIAKSIGKKTLPAFVFHLEMKFQFFCYLDIEMQNINVFRVDDDIESKQIAHRQGESSEQLCFSNAHLSRFPLPHFVGWTQPDDEFSKAFQFSFWKSSAFLMAHHNDWSFEGKGNRMSKNRLSEFFSMLIWLGTINEGRRGFTVATFSFFYREHPSDVIRLNFPLYRFFSRFLF